MNYPDAPGLQEIMDASLADRMHAPGGIVTIEVIRDSPRGPEVIQRRLTHNLVVLSGKKQIWRTVTGLNTNTFDQGRIGTSGATETSSDTNVLSPVTGTLQTVDSKTLLSGTRTMQIVWSYPSGAGSKSATGIQEMAILNQNTSPGGSCMVRATFSSVSMALSDKLKISWSGRIT